MYKQSVKTKEPESEEHGYNYALFLLNLRFRTKGEVIQKMRDRGYATTVIDACVEKLCEQDLINDARFAESLIRSLKDYKQFGFFMIQKKLTQKLLPREVVNAVLAENLSIADELKIAKRYLNKEGLNINDVNYEQRQKISYKLNSRGFRGEVISKIFSNITPFND